MSRHRVFKDPRAYTRRWVKKATANMSYDIASASTLSLAKPLPGLTFVERETPTRRCSAHAGGHCQAEKRTLPGMLADVPGFACVAALYVPGEGSTTSTSWCRNVNLLPFR